jgi:hypothetical protein
MKDISHQRAPRKPPRFVCSICRATVEHGYSHNARPVNAGRCCSECNYDHVIPARMHFLLHGEVRGVS